MMLRKRNESHVHLFLLFFLTIDMVKLLHTVGHCICQLETPCFTEQLSNARLREVGCGIDMLSHYLHVQEHSAHTRFGPRSKHAFYHNSIYI